MSRDAGDGTPLYKHYEALAKVNKPGFELQQSEAISELKKFNYIPPPIFSQIYTIFWDIRNRTDPTTFISYQELNAYCQLTNTNLSPSDTKIFRDLDYEYMIAGITNKE